MYTIVEPLIQYLTFERVQVDYYINRVHKFTSLILMFIAIILTSKVIISEAVICNERVTSVNPLSAEILNAYCLHNYEQSGSDYPRIPSYYQYLPLLIFIAGIGYYLPKFFLDLVESGKISHLIQNLSAPIQGF